MRPDKLFIKSLSKIMEDCRQNVDNQIIVRLMPAIGARNDIERSA